MSKKETVSQKREFRFFWRTTPMYCPWCGAQLPNVARYCMNCGEKVGGPGPTVARAAAAPTVQKSLDIRGYLAEVRSRYERVVAANIPGVALALISTEEEQLLEGILKKLPATFTSRYRDYCELGARVNNLAFIMLGLAPCLAKAYGSRRLLFLATDSDTLAHAWSFHQAVRAESVEIEFSTWEDVGTMIFKPQQGTGTCVLGDLDWHDEPQTGKSLRPSVMSAADQPSTTTLFLHQIGKISAIEVPVRF